MGDRGLNSVPAGTDVHNEAPPLIAIDPDDYQAESVGHLADGRQFFLTTPYVPVGDEFVALYT